MQLFSLIVSLILAVVFCSIGIYGVCFAIKNKKSNPSWFQGAGVAGMFFFITIITIIDALAKFENVASGKIQTGLLIFTISAIIATGFFVAGLIMEAKESKKKSKERFAKKTAEIFDQEFQAQFPNPDLIPDASRPVDSILAEIGKTAQDIRDHIDSCYIAGMADIERNYQKNKFAPEFVIENPVNEPVEEIAKEPDNELVVVP